MKLTIQSGCTRETRPSEMTEPSGLPDNTAGCRVAGRQRNHDSWFLPPDLPAGAGDALWLAVAYWGCREGRAFCRDDVARVFCISPRRAADVMTYLTNDRSDVVEIRKDITHPESGRRVAMYLVLSVCVQGRQPPVTTGTGRPNRAGSGEKHRHEEELMAQARRLFLHQRSLLSGA